MKLTRIDLDLNFSWIYIYILYIYIYATSAAFMSTLRRINVQQKIGTRHFRGLMRVDAIWYSRPQSDGFPSLGKTTSPATKGWPTSMLRYFHDFPCNSSHIRDFPVTYTRLVPPFVNAKLGFALLSNFTWVYGRYTERRKMHGGYVHQRSITAREPPSSRANFLGELDSRKTGGGSSTTRSGGE